MNLDISPNFRPNLQDSLIMEEILKLEATPEAIRYFASVCDRLSDYSYWFLLSTLWVSYTGWSDLQLWKKLFVGDRPGRKRSVMKPSEVEVYKNLSYFVTAYRAHRPQEKDWISYTLDLKAATRFAIQRDVKEISEYKLRKKDIIALFLRRGEKEVIMLEPVKAEFVRTLEIREGQNEL